MKGKGEAAMADRAELVEAALDVYPEGLALLDEAGRVIFWNHAAEIITGHPGANIIGRELPQALEPLTSVRRSSSAASPAMGAAAWDAARWCMRSTSRGTTFPRSRRSVILRDPLGGRIGTATVFHPSEHANALPHGDTSEGSEVRASQAELRDQLEAEMRALCTKPFRSEFCGSPWTRREGMRKTHGARACEAMLENVERTLANHLRAGDEIGRWGDEEFLVLSHEPSGEVLANHGAGAGGHCAHGRFPLVGRSPFAHGEHRRRRSRSGRRAGGRS